MRFVLAALLLVACKHAAEPAPQAASKQSSIERSNQNAQLLRSTRAISSGRRRNQRFCYQGCDALNDLRPAYSLAGRNGDSRVERKRPDKYRQSTQDSALGRGQQLVAPGQCRAQRLMSGYSRAPALP